MSTLVHFRMADAAEYYILSSDSATFPLLFVESFTFFSPPAFRKLLYLEENSEFVLGVLFQELFNLFILPMQRGVHNESSREMCLN